MSAKGWIRLHRKMQDSEVFKDPDLLRLWMILLMKASHSERSVEHDGEMIDLKTGQLITGRKSLQAEYNEGVSNKNKVNDTTLWNWLKKLEKMESVFIETAPSRKYSIVTLNQWDDYQTDGDLEEKTDAAPDVKNEEVSVEMGEFMDIKPEDVKEVAAPKKPKKGKRVYEKGDIEYNLSSRLFYWMLQNNPKAKAPNPQKWADTIRLMIERDDRDPEDIKEVIDWSQNNSFWKANILSTEKLRKQFDTLYIQMIEEKKKKSSGGSSSRGSKKNDLLREMMEREAQNNEPNRNNQTFLSDK